MAKNPLENLIKMYKEQVEEADKQGHACDFKIASDTLIKELRKGYSSCLFHPYTIDDKDIKYLDGYFIFGFGTNSVLHFRIKECPGWLFGVFWEFSNDNVRGEFFAQFEKDIDKFKPSASAIVENIYLSECNVCEGNKLTGNQELCMTGMFDVFSDIKFIETEPYLAFCRHHQLLDYNHVYMSRNKAKRKYFKWVKHEDKEAKYTKIFNAKTVKWVEKNIIPNYKGARIRDCGDHCTPRYDIIAPLSLNSDLVSTVGCYSLDEEESKGLEKFMGKLSRKADRLGIWWSTCFNYSIDFYEDNK